MILSQSRHGGDIFKLPGGERDGFLDFSININPLGLSRKAKKHLFDPGKKRYCGILIWNVESLFLLWQTGMACLTG